jgi:thiol-disulfide isomerase/thioredoxin
MNVKSWLKKNWLNTALTSFVLLILFYPPAKVWMLQRLIGTGFFNVHSADKLVKAKQMIFRNEKGDLIATESLEGKIIFINFWATWCAPCLAELPSIQNLYNRYRNDNRIVFIMADADNRLVESSLFLRKRAIQLPVFSMYSHIDASLYSGTLPTTLILDKNGMIILHHKGIGRYDTAEMYELLDRHLKAQETSSTSRVSITSLKAFFGSAPRCNIGLPVCGINRKVGML